MPEESLISKEHVTTTEDPVVNETPTDEETLHREDPFEDFNQFKDEESGLYFKKYKTPMDAFNGFAEMQKEFGRLKREKSPEAPESYELDFSDVEFIPEDFTWKDETFDEFETVFKKHNFTTEAVKDLIALKYKLEEPFIPNADKAREELGSEADEIIHNVNTAAKKYFTEEERDVMAELGYDSRYMRILNKWSKLVGEKPIPGEMDGVPEADWEELKAEAFDYKKNNPDIEHNETKQRIYDRKLEAAIKAEMRQTGKK